MRLEHGVEEALHEGDFVGSVRRRELGLRVGDCVYQGVDGVVLGARGRGLRESRPDLVAELFERVVHRVDVGVEVFEGDVVCEGWTTI